MADLSIARRIGGGLWLGGATIAAILIPLAPLDNSSIGDAGWFLGSVIILFAFGVAIRFLRFGDRVGPNEMLALNYVAAVLVGVLMWLNGAFAPYTELLALAVLYTAAVHPPRRVLAFVAFSGLVLASPLIYDGDQALAEDLARFLLWSGLAIAATVFTSNVRIERASLLAISSEARSEARIDPLTGLGNRRAFDETLAAATLRSSRTHSPLSVIIADLDSFKAINDNHGLPAGDRTLKEVAGVIDDAVRRPDSCFRWGGDEFVIVADVDHDGAAKLAGRLAREVAGRCRRPDGGPVTLHVGTAEAAEQGGDPGSLLAAASSALKPPGTRTP
jgi:diguanylate cyclase (GGDEF)-like protein